MTFYSSIGPNSEKIFTIVYTKTIRCRTSFSHETDSKESLDDSPPCGIGRVFVGLSLHYPLLHTLNATPLHTSTVI